MQSQQQFFDPRQQNDDPREQQSALYKARSIQEASINEEPTIQEEPMVYRGEAYEQGEKLRPTPAQTRGPGRLTALFIALGLILALGAGALFATGRISASRSALASHLYSLSGHSKLVVHNGSGQVHVHKGSANQIEIKTTSFSYGITLGSNQAQPTYTQDGNTVTIDGSQGNPNVVGTSGYDLDITVPEDVDLDIQNNSGDIDVGEELTGSASLKTGSGDIKANGINGDVKIETGSGDIKANNLSDKVEIKSGSGEIKLNNVSGKLDLQTGSGDINVDGVTLKGDGSIKAGSGDIDLENVTLNADANYQLHSGSGSVTVKLPEDGAFTLNLKSGSGDINNDFDGTSIGTNPKARLDIDTGSGDIDVKKR
jgi:hypothetical protein